MKSNPKPACRRTGPVRLNQSALRLAIVSALGTCGMMGAGGAHAVCVGNQNQNIPAGSYGASYAFCEGDPGEDHHDEKDGGPGDHINIQAAGNFHADANTFIGNFYGIPGGVLTGTSIGGYGVDEGDAGPGGNITITSSGSVSMGGTANAGSIASLISAYSQGGRGDLSNDNNNSDGGDGGAGYTVSVTNTGALVMDGTVAPTSDGLFGIWARSTGGNGGEQNNPLTQLGEQVGGDAGRGGSVTVANSGSIGLGTSSSRLHGSKGATIEAVSTGGFGGDNNGNAGGGGGVQVTNTGSVRAYWNVTDVSSGSRLYGINALSQGGTGNASSDDSDPGGAGGAGADVSVTSSAAVVLDVSSNLALTGAGIAARSLGGTGGGGPSEDHSGGNGGRSGKVTVVLQDGGSVTTHGIQLAGIRAESNGGNGGPGGSGVALAGQAGGGGYGGDAGDVQVSIGPNASVSTSGNYATGVVAWSLGGGGGVGGDFLAVLGGSGSSGGDGGNSGNVSVTNAGAIITQGDQAFGIDAQANSGGGGAGGIAVGVVAEVGGDGGIGGHAGTVQLNNTGSISTSGYGAIGMSAQANGGGGGNAGAAGGIIAVGGNPGAAANGDANGGALHMSNAGTIITSGDAATAISATSIGGGGGSASGNVGVISVGGDGEAGGSGAAIYFGGDDTGAQGQLGTIRTSGDFSYGVFATSTGGGGGNGGDTFDVSVAGSVVVGGSGNSGGDGGSITFKGTDPASITTQGQNAHGILAQSIGGGGGAGGDMFHGGFLEVISIQVGGDGQRGGNGNALSFDWQNLAVDTSGSAARGIALQSIGGGGGTGGGLRSESMAVEGQLVVGVGGTGGGGGNGGTVSANIGQSSIHTHGPAVVDGSGDDEAGDGSGDGVDDEGNQLDEEGHKVSDASAVFVQSIGGGGGAGGSAKDQSGLIGIVFTEIGTAVGWDNVVTVGGQGGAGGDGADVSVNVWNSDLGTEGQYSHGVFAQSIGGGGGDGGSASAFSVDAVFGVESINIQDEAAVGGRCVDSTGSCAGGDGGDVVVALGDGSGSGPTTVQTSGDYSNGVLAQSIGGGGGDGGSSNAYSFDFETGAALSASALVTVGAQGGAGGDAGQVEIITDQGVQIATTGSGARGLVAQSVGGGGGTGQGTAVYVGAEGQVSKLLSAGFSIDVGVGMTGGEGGNAADASVSHFGTISTTGRDSDGVLVQSIGGGGGVGGSMGAGHGDLLDAVFNVVKTTLDHNPMTIDGSITVNVGGEGGEGGNAGAAKLLQDGIVATAGDYADGVVVQSIGGGGGAGGGSSSSTYLNWLDLNIAVGGRGGEGGQGGQAWVDLLRDAQIQTQGYNAYGVLAQSIGGGGGQGGSGSLATKGKLEIGAAVGGTGGDADHGGTVTFQSESRHRIQTFGDASHAVALQSIGGGGGTGGLTQGVGGTRVGASLSFSLSMGGLGGDGGDGGAVNMCVHDLDCGPVSIYTGGHMASALVAQSIGGGGGIGSLGSPDQAPALAYNFNLDLLLGGKGGDGGDGGAVTVNGKHGIVTRGDFSQGIVAQSIGGGGGLAGANDPLGLQLNDEDSGNRVQVVVTLGSLADGIAGNGGTVNVASTGDIQTLGDGSHALVAQSIGGGGGMAGTVLKDDDDSDAPAAPAAWPDGTEVHQSLTLGAGGDAVGTAVGSSGNPDDGSGQTVVDVSHDGNLRTLGTWAMGVLAQSIGGGGGVGHAGMTVDGTLNNGASHIQVGSLGRTGAAAQVDVDLVGVGDLILTTGAGAYGVLAQSISSGGGLGTGMVADSAAKIQVGGGSDTIKVASGSAAGAVSVSARTGIYTAGDDAIGLAAQSIGGGGGVGGVLAFDGTALAGAELQVGGYMAGTGGAVAVDTTQFIATQGDRAYGLVAQSVGGGGGIGVIGISDSASQDATHVLIGGNDPGDSGTEPGESGAGHIDIDVGGQIVTGGAGADALVVQSIGGGGGLGGATGAAMAGDGPTVEPGATPYQAGLRVGGAASSGAGGSIGSPDKFARLAAAISTSGAFAQAVLLQSIGAGGGQGGIAAVGAAPIALDLELGGNSRPESASSADHSAGGAIALEFDANSNNSKITTLGYGAHAVLVQSIGGGGGLAEASAAGGSGSVQVGGSNGAWGSGGQIQVAPASRLRVATLGNRAHGVVLQSIGGGGGLATVYSGYPGTPAGAGQFSLALGAGQGGSGDGGAVDLAASADVQTRGTGSIGIIAQSVGGGGGIVSAGDADALSHVSLGGGDDVQGNGGAVSVRLSAGTVATQGVGAHGVVAQSVGGGGGIAGDLGQALSLDRDGWASTTGQVSGNGGAVTVAIQNSVATTGAHAYGVIAQSVGGGGGLAGAAPGGFAGSVNAATGNTENWAGRVDVTVDGAVSATGEGSVGVFAQSVGSDGKGSPAEVTVNGSVLGGSGSGAGVWISTNAVGESMLEIGTTGVVSALSGVAVRYDGEASMVVRNYGVMDGGHECTGVGVCFIDNQSTGTLTGATLYQADVANAGRLVVGSAGRYGRLTVAGDYRQASAGVLRADVDFAGMRAAHMTVQGDAQLDGQFDLAAASLLPGRELAVLDVAGTSTGTLQAKDSPIFDFDIRQVGKQQRVSVKGADFRAASQGLARNQRAVAGHLQEIWDQGGTVALAPLFAALNAAANQGSGAYRDRLGGLAPGVTAAPAVQMVAGMARFTGSMMSCPAMQRSGTDGREQDCFWGQVERRSTDQDAAQGTSGYTYDSTTYQVGGQREIRPGWFVGGSVAYQNNSLRADNGRAGGSGDAGYAGVVLKHQDGPWVYSAAVGGGYGSYELERTVGIDGYDRQAGSSPDVYSAGMRLRVSRHIGVTGQFYLKPYVDLDALYARMPGYTESGGPLSLEVDASDQFVVGLSPMLEVGGRLDLPQGATLRPYAYAGASFLSDDSWSTHARLQGAPAGSAGFDTTLPGDDVIGRFGVGMQVYNRSGLDFRLQYDGEVSSKATSHAGQLKVMYRF